jgi:site-specific recombinase XerD
MQPKTADLLQIQVAGSFVEAVQTFLLDRKSRNLAAGSVRYYLSELELFRAFLEKRGVIDVEGVSSDEIRTYLAEVAKRRNPRGVHASFRAVRAFFRWYGREIMLEGWRSPLANIRGPRVPRNPLPGVPIASITAMIDACLGDNGLRDRAILNLLYSSGLRAGELVGLIVGDVNLTTGAVWVGCGKGGRSRSTFCCTTTRKMLRSYLRERGDPDVGEPLFISRSGKGLSYSGLVHLLRARAEQAGCEAPGAHDFRRAFALSYLRAGGDLITLARLMGHSSLEVLKIYLDIAQADLAIGYARFGPSAGK